MKMLLTALAATTALVAAVPAAQAQPRHDDRHQFDRGNDGRGFNGNQGGRHWNQGQRLDNRYGAYQPVNDWRNRRLAPPRRGYHWVRSGDDYVQAALVGGLIASVVAASR